jgi:hypothetical protein
MGIPHPVVEAFMLAMLDPQHDFTLGRGIAAQLVGDQHTRCLLLLLQQFPEKALGGSLITPALNKAVENEAPSWSSPPQPVLFARR